MIDFTIAQLFPDFILADKNGYAMAKAIEKALQIVCNTAQTGIDNVQDIDKMPEWRLDEMAWELNCLYDYSADVEIKRRWIKDATPLYSALGTPQAVYNFLEGFFEQVELEEYWQYAGDPYHFRVTVSGEWNDTNEEWLRRAVATSKNVRSILDDIAVGSGTTIIVKGEGAVIARFPYGMTGTTRYAGTYPQENTIGKLSQSDILLTADSGGHLFGYPLSGTRPDINMLGVLGQGSIIANGESLGYRYPYPNTSKNTQAGTIPQANFIAAMENKIIRASPDGEDAVFVYTLCGDTICGQDDL